MAVQWWNTTTAPFIYGYLMTLINNPIGVSGLMGNLVAESGLSPNNLQNHYNQVFGMSDAQYTEGVDNGSYTNFVHDSAGYGLAQWTWWTRKRDLLALCRSRGVSISDITAQMDWLITELRGSYSGVLKALQSATDLRTASNAVLINFERPGDQGASVQEQRYQNSLAIYNSYGGGGTVIPPDQPPENPDYHPTVPDTVPDRAPQIQTGLKFVLEPNHRRLRERRKRNV